MVGMLVLVARLEEHGATIMPEKLMTCDEAAAALGIAEQTLRGWRFENREDQPEYIRVGRLVRYRPSVIERWLSERSYTSDETAEWE